MLISNCKTPPQGVLFWEGVSLKQTMARGMIAYLIQELNRLLELAKAIRGKAAKMEI